MPENLQSSEELRAEIDLVRQAVERARAMGIRFSPRRAAPPAPVTPLVNESGPMSRKEETLMPLPPASKATTHPAATLPEMDSAAFPPKRTETLEQIRADIGDCRRCKLAATRTKIAFGDGTPEARVVFVGEGPGKDEDLQGIPFVGRAGQLLTDIIEKGMGIPRKNVYICNVVKCRPTVDLKFTKDRPPDEEETAACGGFLLRQLRAVDPEVIVTLGNPATQFLLRTKTGITRLRGNWQQWEGIPVMPTFHPAYVLRNPPSKREVWEDIQKVMARLGIEPPRKS